MSEKAARVGFDWPDGQGARDKVGEELARARRGRAAGDKGATERELGDVLFALANYARKLEIDPEAALRQTLARFATRVRSVESAVAAQGRRGHRAERRAAGRALGTGEGGGESGGERRGRARARARHGRSSVFWGPTCPR